MSTTFCPHCHQPIAEDRAGIRLPAVKVKIFDVVRRAAQHGIRVEYINWLCFDGRANAVTIRNHIKQINDRLQDTEFRITGAGRANWKGYYRIERRRR
jgi:hypothetical protein